MKTGRIRVSGLSKRLSGCVIVTALVGLLAFSRSLAPLEELLLRLLWAGYSLGTQGVPLGSEIGIVAAAAMAPALFRLDEPLVMIAFAAGLGFLYSLILSVVLLTSEVALPILTPLIGLVLSTAVVETLAWSDEHQRRRRLEQMEASRQQFTDMLVHDLKARMSSILMALSALQKSLGDISADTQELMDTMRASSGRMLILTGNLLDIRKFEESKMVLKLEQASLLPLLKDCVRDQRAAGGLANVAIDLDATDDIPVRIDPGIFTRILMNLLWNALQNAPRESVIRVTYTGGPQTGATVTIANDGEPIPAADIDDLFEAFITGRGLPMDNRAASTGLGLTFCKLAMEAHGGTIRIDSPIAPGNRGVRVVLSLPRAA